MTSILGYHHFRNPLSTSRWNGTWGFSSRYVVGGLKPSQKFYRHLNHPLCMVENQYIPSGKHGHSYWTWPFSSLIYLLKMVIFHSYAAVYQRVHIWKPIPDICTFWNILKHTQYVVFWNTSTCAIPPDYWRISDIHRFPMNRIKVPRHGESPRHGGFSEPPKRTTLFGGVENFHPKLSGRDIFLRFWRMWWNLISGSCNFPGRSSHSLRMHDVLLGISSVGSHSCWSISACLWDNSQQLSVTS